MADGKLPPLTPAAFQVMLALAGGPAHGYRIMGFVHDVTAGEVQLGPGTLYRTLARLSADGLVEETHGRRTDEPHDARRRYYRLTGLGWRTASREAELQARLVDAATRVGLLPERTRRADTA